MILETPTKLLLPSDSDEVKRFLTFFDKSVQFQISKLKKNYRWANSDPDSFNSRMEALKMQSKRCLLLYDDQGRPYTYSGLWKELQSRFKWNLENKIDMALDTRAIPWHRTPDEPRYYQTEAFNALKAARHAGIQLPTGSGKSLIIAMLCRYDAVQTIVVSPSGAITDQLYVQFQELFGKKFVGKYGDGRKDFGKLFTVATAQALTRLTPDDEAYQALSKVKRLIFDESHVTPADTFEAVCMGIGANAPERYFLSATQLRTDGSEMLLKGITGPIVYSKSFTELVSEGFLAKPIIKIFKVPTYGPSNAQDPKTETRNQLYSNPNVNKMAAQIASKTVLMGNRQVVILIEEFKQFMMLKNFLSVPFEFVHGGASQEAKQLLPKEYWDCDRDRIIQDFNDGKVKCLIGTSAISTGVDLKPVGCLIYLQGGLSEIKIRQGIGRGTRIVPGKKDFWVIDMEVVGSKTMERHAKERQKIYAELGDVTIYDR